VTDAPIGAKDLLQVTHPGFLANKTYMNIHPGETVVYPTINLTGDAVVAGRVISNPSGLPVSGASVQVCPHGQNSSICSTVATNAVGVFWAIAPPVLVDVQATAQGYVGNTTLANPCSDCWQWIGDVRVDEYAYVSGIVRGLPSGLPVFNATVSACSTLGIPVGACGFSVATELSGHFLLPVPANTYILQTSDTFYNTTYLPLSLAPGST
jgi:hypothetical protein